MKQLLFVLVAVLGLEANANIFNYYTPVCGFAYRYESYALGLDNVYRGRSEAPIMMDEYCYKLGQNVGRSLQKHENPRDCKEAYLEALEQGSQGGPFTLESPTECFNPAQSVGLTLLSNQARRESKAQAGTECASAYNKGYKDGKNNYAQTLQRTNRLSHCYSTGHSDAQLY